MAVKSKAGLSEKAIKRKLSNLMRDFLDSIEDKEIRELIKDNSLITGGSIASMLLGESVNDFDIYLTNIDAAERVLNYFVERDFEKRHLDIKRIKIENIKGDLEERLYCKLSSGIARTLHKDRKYSARCVTSNALTLSDDVQIITRFYGTPEEVHRNFDFIHCTNYYQPATNTLVLNTKAMHSLMSKRLYYSGSLYPIASLLRIRKFLDRGWTITAGQVVKIALQLTGIKLTPAILAEQLMGVDLLFMSAFLSKLKYEEGTELDMGIVSELLDEVFD